MKAGMTPSTKPKIECYHRRLRTDTANCMHPSLINCLNAFLAVCLVALAAGCSPQQPTAKTTQHSAHPSLSPEMGVADAWIKTAPPGATVLAGYLDLQNGTSEDWSLTKLSSSAFKSIEMHSMSMQDGMMRMRQLDQILIPAHSIVRLTPNGKHLMLRQPKTAIVKGEPIPLILHFLSAAGETKVLNLIASVGDSTSGDMHEH
jgi:copper(I)-binding protein